MRMASRMDGISQSDDRRTLLRIHDRSIALAACWVPRIHDNRPQRPLAGTERAGRAVFGYSLLVCDCAGDDAHGLAFREGQAVVGVTIESQALVRTSGVAGLGPGMLD